jgi:tRNA uridine 5-carbamoylmethylation protein Kti12
MAKVILFRGKAGTGKSTLSNELAKRIHFTVLHKDDIYDSVAGFVSEHSERNAICFDLLYRFLQNVMDANTATILDFGLNHSEDVRKLKNWIVERGGELKIIHCICSDESIWSERLSRRSLDPLPNQLITNLAELKEHYKDLRTDWFEGEFVVDTADAKAVVIENILSFLLEK